LLRAAVKHISLDGCTEECTDAAVAECHSNLHRIVCHQLHSFNPEVLEDKGHAAVNPLVVAEAEPPVGIDGVKPLVLQVVRRDLVRQPDPASLIKRARLCQTIPYTGRSQKHFDSWAPGERKCFFTSCGR
jgi:hypothetical protein